MIKRELYLSKLRDSYDSELIKVIMGVRRCGKSILLTQIIEELKERGKKIKDQYFEPNLFDVRLDISLNNNQVIPFEYEYDYDGYPKTYKNFSRTFFTIFHLLLLFSFLSLAF